MTTTALDSRWRETSADIEHASKSINLSQAERTLSIAGGVKLALSGLKGIFKSPFSSIIKISAGGYLLTRGVTGHCELYSRMGRNTTEPVNVNIRSSFVVDKPRQEVYDFWRKLDNLPLFMKHLESVEVIDEKHSHWVLKLPLGAPKVSWDAEIVKDEPGYMIGWSSLPDSLIDNAGKVVFKDSEDGNGTQLDIVITYRPPAGGFGGGIAHILNPVFKNLVDNDVRNFKQYMDIDGGQATGDDNSSSGSETGSVVFEETTIFSNPSWQETALKGDGQPADDGTNNQSMGSLSDSEQDKQSPYSDDKGQQPTGQSSVL